MTVARSDAEGHVPFAGVAPRLTCERCGSFLRRDAQDDGRQLCDPCLKLIESCLPFAGMAGTPQTLSGQAPSDVNLLELVAGVMLVHDALHPGEPLHLREALAGYGVDADHVKIWQVVGKLKRRHGLVLAGEARQPGYRVEDWTWEARQVRSSVRG